MNTGVNEKQCEEKLQAIIELKFSNFYWKKTF
jgi:hypothetical protein